MEATPDTTPQTATGGQHQRVAFCECGARLAGGTEQDLFEATQRHLALHHPQLLGAMKLETVVQMAEEVGGL